MERGLIITLITLIVLISGCTEEKSKDDVQNIKPILNILDAPTSGYPDTPINFTVNAYDPDGMIILYEWDFDGNGIFEWNSSIEGNVSFIYLEVGFFHAICRVTDNDNEIAEMDQLIEIIQRPTVPIIYPTPTIYFDYVWDGLYVSETFYLNGSTFTSNLNETVNNISIVVGNEIFECYFYHVNCTGVIGYEWSYRLDTKKFSSERTIITVIAHYSESGNISNSTYINIRNYRNFTLYISNQNRWFDPVNITVRLGGTVIIEDTFYYADEYGHEAHNWIEYVFNVSCGPHMIEGYSNAPDASFNDSIMISANSYGVIDYFGKGANYPGLIFEYCGPYQPRFM